MDPTRSISVSPVNLPRQSASSTGRTASDAERKTGQVAGEVFSDKAPDIQNTPNIPSRLDPEVGLQFKRVQTPQDHLDKLKSLTTNLEIVQTKIRAVHQKALARAKEMKVPHGVINHLPKNELIKFENELRSLNVELQATGRQLNKIRGEFAQLPQNSPIKSRFSDKLTELDLKLKLAESEMKQQLNFHMTSRIARLFELMARILHEINEGIRLMSEIR